MTSKTGNANKEKVRISDELALLRAENAALKAENETLKSHVALYKSKIAALIRKLFGKKSEKIDPNQLEMDLGVESKMVVVETGESGDTRSSTPKRKRGKAILVPEHFEEVRTVIDPPEVEANPDAYECIGEEELVELDVDPLRMIRRVTVRRKFRPKDRQSAPVIAPAPKRIIPNSIASAGLLAFIIVSKYIDHLPLYRLEAMFRRNGVILDRKRMSAWLGKTGHWLRIIYDEMKLEAFAGGYLQGDETPVRYLSPGNGSTKKGYLWTFLAPGKAVLFDWHTGRGAKCLRRMLKYFRGDLQCDGYAAYKGYNDWRVANAQPRLQLHACWAHVRRKFVEAGKSELAAHVLLEIQTLYGVEDRLREANAPAEERQRERREHSLPAVDRIKSLLDDAPHILPKSPLGEAVSYIRGLWPKLTSYIEDGRIEIDNNLVENAIRPVALGRKNYLFLGGADAGQTSAILYSVVQTCRMLDVDVRAYLMDVLERLPYLTAAQARQLTPAKWKAAREEQAESQAA